MNESNCFPAVDFWRERYGFPRYSCVSVYPARPLPSPRGGKRGCVIHTYLCSSSSLHLIIHQAQRLLSRTEHGVLLLGGCGQQLDVGGADQGSETPKVSISSFSFAAVASREHDQLWNDADAAHRDADLAVSVQIGVRP